MPNIGAFIAWGLITALFIERAGSRWSATAWHDPDRLGRQDRRLGRYDGVGIVGPMITYLLPILIGYTGGGCVYGHPRRRGRRDRHHGRRSPAPTSPMFLGAMIMGPLGGWAMKSSTPCGTARSGPASRCWSTTSRPASWGVILAIVGFFVLGPVVTAFTERRRRRRRLPGRQRPAAADLDPHRAGQGAVPQQRHQPRRADAAGHHRGRGDRASRSCSCSRPTPGPGLGLLLAYTFFGKGIAKASAPGAAIIQFFGGIHEIYFPYVLMKPKLIVAMILGGMTGVFINVLFDSACARRRRRARSSRSTRQTAGGSFVGRDAVGVFGAPPSRSLVARAAAQDWTEPRTRATSARATAADGGDEGQEVDRLGAASALRRPTGQIRRSSSPATPAWARRRWVPRCSARRSRTPATGRHGGQQGDRQPDRHYDVVVTHQDLTDRAKQRTPSAIHVSVDNFMGSPRYDEIVELIDQSNVGVSRPRSPRRSDGLGR